jgi:hypothetical protein
MKKLLLVFIIFVWFQIDLNAQVLEPQIKFELWFEDALGNKDTVTMGFDTLSEGFIEAKWGETQLRGIPFDSILEVRGADKSGYYHQTNPSVQYYDPIWCTTYPISKYQSVVIYAKHWPVTITWDSTYFAEQCYDWTHFTRSWTYLEHPKWVNGDIRLLAKQSKLIVYEQYMQQSVSYYNTRLEPVEGGKQDTVYNLWLGLAGNEPGVVSTEELHKSVEAAVYPNPTEGHLSVTLPIISSDEEVHDVIIYDMMGEIQNVNWSRDAAQLILDAANLPQAQYQGLIHFEDGSLPARFMFMKQ